MPLDKPFTCCDVIKYNLSSTDTLKLLLSGIFSFLLLHKKFASVNQFQKVLAYFSFNYAKPNKIKSKTLNNAMSPHLASRPT